MDEKIAQGILLVDKLSGWTSFDVVNKIRGLLERHLREKTGERRRVKVGHSGTLDPFATGLMVVAIGKETKNIDKYVKLDKTYVATMRLGSESTTGDPEGVITEVKGALVPTKEQLLDALEGFKGEIIQIPPAYSAIKVDGVRAYTRARRGEDVKMEPRKTTINSLEITAYNYPMVEFVCDVSSGTYIRALAEDIAKEVGTVGYLEALRRTTIGDFKVDGALRVSKELDLEELLGRL